MYKKLNLVTTVWIRQRIKVGNIIQDNKTLCKYAVSRWFPCLAYQLRLKKESANWFLK